MPGGRESRLVSPTTCGMRGLYTPSGAIALTFSEPGQIA